MGLHRRYQKHRWQAMGPPSHFVLLFNPSASETTAVVHGEEVSILAAYH